MIIYKTFDTFRNGQRTFALTSDTPIYEYIGAACTLQVFVRLNPRIQPFLAVLSVSGNVYVSAGSTISQAAVSVGNSYKTAGAKPLANLTADVAAIRSSIPSKFTPPDNINIE